LVTEETEGTKGVRRRRLKNALQVIAESVLDVNPQQADKTSAVSFSALTLGWVLPAGGEVIITTDSSFAVATALLRRMDFADLRGFAYCFLVLFVGFWGHRRPRFVVQLRRAGREHRDFEKS
jgi:hypothetical protein